MAEPTRIIVKRTDDVATVVEQLIDAQQDTVIIQVAPGALFGQTLSNFKLLKREAALLNKDVFIESSDASIRERAMKSGLGINEGEETPVEEEPVVVPAKTPRKGRSVRVKVATKENTPEFAEEERPRASAKSRRARSMKAQQVSEDVLPDAEVEEETTSPVPGRVPQRARRGEPTRPVRSARKGVLLWVTFAAVVGLGVVWYVAAAVLPKATITVVTAKKTWDFDGTLTVDKSISKFDSAGSRVPGQVFVITDSVTKRVPATGKQFVSRKASGVITVYNAYSSQSQTIVTNTRFATPSGIVFRITAPLVIPGAKIENGKITPSSIDAQVVADKAGAESNLGPTPLLYIPGFAKTPKYNSFYGELKQGTSGGFVGETAVPTEKDVAAAKEQGSKDVATVLTNKVKTSVPADFTVLEGASKLSITRQTVDPVAASDGTVGVTTEGQLSILAFRETDVRNLLQARVQAAIGDGYKVDTDTLKYGALNPKAVVLASGRMLVPTTYNVELSRDVKGEAIKQKVAGLQSTKLNTAIFEIDGITGGKYELWPFYVKTVPTNTEKIEVVIQ